MAIVGDLAPELVAALALVAVLAVYFMVEALEAIARAVGVPNWPIIGGALYGAIAHVATWVGDSLAWLWQHANPINLFLATTHWTIQQFSNYIGLGMQGITEAASRLATVAIPGAINTAEGLARDLYADASAYSTYIAGRVNALIAGVQSQIVSTATAIEATISSDIAAVEGRISGAVSGAVAAATAAALGRVQSLQGWVTQELGALHTTIDGEIQAAQQGIGAQIGDAVQTVEQDLAPGIAAAAAAAAAAATAFKTWEQDCGNNLCNNLSGFANTIGAILGIVSDGALVALVAEAVTNPEGLAEFIVNDIAEPATDAAETVASLLGVKLAA
jgi:hypothetical protein